MTRIRLAAALSIGLLGACADDGTPPTVADLTMAPLLIPVGAQTTVSGTMTFVDEDGDVSQLAAAVIVPGGARTELPAVPVQTTGEPTQGWVNWALLILPPTPGLYELQLWVIDESGNESNQLTGSLTAQ